MSPHAVVNQSLVGLGRGADADSQAGKPSVTAATRDHISDFLNMKHLRLRCTYIETASSLVHTKVAEILLTKIM